MKCSIYLNSNSEETLDKLSNLGFRICDCCRFSSVKWIHYFYRESTSTKEVHGVYPCGECDEDEEDTMRDCIKCSIVDSLEHGNVFIANNVEDFINFINNVIV